MENLKKFIELTEKEMVKVHGGIENYTGTSFKTGECTNDPKGGDGYDSCKDTDRDW